MTPGEFISKWSDSTLRERSGSQSHFIDLCHLLGEDPDRRRPQRRMVHLREGRHEDHGGGEGWADVWKRGCFGWEYKGQRQGPERGLRAAPVLRAASLENPPLLIVCDMDRIVIHTNWTNTVQEAHTSPSTTCSMRERRQSSRWAF